MREKTPIFVEIVLLVLWALALLVSPISGKPLEKVQGWIDP